MCVWIQWWGLHHRPTNRYGCKQLARTHAHAHSHTANKHITNDVTHNKNTNILKSCTNWYKTLAKCYTEGWNRVTCVRYCQVLFHRHIHLSHQIKLIALPKCCQTCFFMLFILQLFDNVSSVDQKENKQTRGTIKLRQKSNWWYKTLPVYLPHDRETNVNFEKWEKAYSAMHYEKLVTNNSHDLHSAISRFKLDCQEDTRI